MQRKTILTLTALSAACLLSTGAYAKDEAMNDASMKDTIMDAGMFRDTLHDIHGLFDRIQENRNLAMASQDTVTRSMYQQENRRLHTRALALLEKVSRNWKSATLPAAMTASNTVERYGSATAQRYATESEDTAYVRNTVWQIRNSLWADKLNGRDPMITHEISAMLDAAIARADNPSFKVARAFNRDRLAQKIEFSSRTEELTRPARRSAPPESVTEETRTEETRVEEAPAPTTTEETTKTTERETVAEAPATAEETVTEERIGAASLPKTGGDPSMLILLGGSLMGVGGLLRRRR